MTGPLVVAVIALAGTGLWVLVGWIRHCVEQRADARAVAVRDWCERVGEPLPDPIVVHFAGYDTPPS